VREHRTHTQEIILYPSEEQESKLYALLQEYKNQCAQVTKRGKALHRYGRTTLHKEMYASIRRSSPLGAQMVCNAIYSASQGFKEHPKVGLPILAPVPLILDKNTCTLHLSSVGIYTLNGRIRIDSSIHEVGQIKIATLPYPKKGEWCLTTILRGT